MLKWLLVLSFAWIGGCAVYPDPSSEPRTKPGSEESQPPPDIEKTSPPPRPTTTCPPGMRGSCWWLFGWELLANPV